MSARREPSTPPVIPGHEYSRLLGMGGFADVFLYSQLMPRRSVAVKVLLASSLGDDVRERFRTEADLMAQLSHHPSIVTIHHADVAADGRPYLVMEYCSRPGLGQRYRSERMGVAEVLRIGVRLASAVETAHRAGILHRDIKPANVLVTDFGWPALTDFGIAATTGWSSAAAIGMSIPWSPPELLAEEPRGDERSDVYSLAATVYSLLARRSPFEVADGSNTAADLISRIERAPLAPTGRGDVPESLQAVLARAMDRVPERRHASALAFARGLQQVEAELLLPLTPLDLPEDLVEDPLPGAGGDPGPGGYPTGDHPDDGEGGQATRLRPVRSVSPDAPVAAGAARPPVPAMAGAPASASAAGTGVGAAAPTAGTTHGGPAAGTAGGLGIGTAPAAASSAQPGTAVPGGVPLGPAWDLPPATGPAAGQPAGAPQQQGVPDAWRAQADAVAGDVRADDAGRRRGPARVLAAVGAGVVVLAAVVVAVVLAFRPGAVEVQETAGPTATASAAPTLAVPTPTDLEVTAAAGGAANVRWVNPDPREGDTYLWARVVAGVPGTPTLVEETALTVPAPTEEEGGTTAAPTGQVCVQVQLVRADRRASEPVVGCTA